MMTWRPNNSKSVLHTEIRKERNETGWTVYLTWMGAEVIARSASFALESVVLYGFLTRA